MNDFSNSRRRTNAQRTGDEGRVSAIPSSGLPSLAAGAEEAGLRPVAPAAHSSLHDRLAAGHDWRAGAAILEEHRKTLERVRASEARDTGAAARNCYPRIIPGTRRVA